MTDPAQLPAAAIIARFGVADFDAWKAVFDEAEEHRRRAGFVGHHINRGEDDPNSLSVYMAVGDVDGARAFTTSDELRSLMQRAGVTTPADFSWMKPVREEAVWGRELPSMIVSHGVEDFDAWLAVYDGADDIRQSRGIIGHAANRSMDDPSVVVVYHQAESFDTLRALMQSDELRLAMKEAGANTEPEVSYHTGGWGKRY